MSPFPRVKTRGYPYSVIARVARGFSPWDESQDYPQRGGWGANQERATSNHYNVPASEGGGKADAPDLGSGGVIPCGFNSQLRFAYGSLVEFSPYGSNFAPRSCLRQRKNLRMLKLSEGGGKADAPDLGSGGVIPCGFNSQLRFAYGSLVEFSPYGSNFAPRSCLRQRKNLRMLKLSEGGGKADAPDLGSGGVIPCGFNSQLRFAYGSLVEFSPYGSNFAPRSCLRQRKNLRMLKLSEGGGKADAPDLGSGGVIPCGFNSRPSHIHSCLKTRRQ